MVVCLDVYIFVMAVCFCWTITWLTNSPSPYIWLSTLAFGTFQPLFTWKSAIPVVVVLNALVCHGGFLYCFLGTKRRPFPCECLQSLSLFEHGVAAAVYTYNLVQRLALPSNSIPLSPQE
ncbi:hypothetical protein O6P43_010279 [Quillaja saponaria]|uniref:Uncharacterized protein n=1 Tax=Quillaja saponaria TaxID=32244 RepID=A0AAD7VE17_QUISA|nr:hypothetical protein O6P43_010279 [Quillaja saponaria]